jgi:hypothetical protein
MLATGGNICISPHTQRQVFADTFGAGHLKMEIQAAPWRSRSAPM